PSPIRIGRDAFIAPLGPTEARLEQDNTLVLDFCDLRVGSKRFEGLNTIHAQKLIYESHGFEMNPWDNAVQFKRRLLDRNDFPSSSGFEAVFRFRVGKDAIPDRLLLWVERGNLYRLQINGEEAVWSDRTSPLDHHLHAADIAGAVTEGDNVITLGARPFDIRMELESIYLSGPFSVIEEESRWTIGKPSPLGIGSWRAQGLPFYAQGAVYENRFVVDDIGKRHTIRLPRWAGTAASLHVNESFAGLFGAGQGEALDVTSLLREGVNAVRVRISGSFKNLFGPFHDPMRPRKTAWPAHWKRSPLYGPPPAADYDLIDLGLLDDIRLIAD
ncbi:hypothetical protein, partial [Cohnella nanjingensis]